MLDRKKLAIIHITKKELGLDDQQYRDLLEQATGVRSAKELDEEGFRKLMRFFARSKHFRAHATAVTLRQKMYVRHLVEDLGWDENHLHNFIAKYYHRQRLDELGRREASKLIEALKNILTRRFAAGHNRSE